jgi:hypothetical protein
MAYLTKDAILNADDLPTEEVEVAEWGGKVLVRGLTGTERDRFEFAMAVAKDDPSNVDIRAQVVGRCLVDETGKRLFSDKELAKLGSKSGAALDRVFDVVRSLSGMGGKAVEQRAEDFGNAPSDGSATG